MTIKPSFNGMRWRRKPPPRIPKNNFHRDPIKGLKMGNDKRKAWKLIFCQATRFVWQSRRHYSRLEDVTYNLLAFPRYNIAIVTCRGPRSELLDEQPEYPFRL